MHLQCMIKAPLWTNEASSAHSSCIVLIIVNLLMGAVRKLMANNLAIGLNFENEVWWHQFSWCWHHHITCCPLCIISWLSHTNCSCSLQVKYLFSMYKNMGVWSMFRMKSWCLCSLMSFCCVMFMKFKVSAINSCECCWIFCPHEMLISCHCYGHPTFVVLKYKPQ